jgi:uncharacterized protein YjbI with pentapeptide repeats
MVASDNLHDDRLRADATPKLPRIEAKAEDLEALRKAVDDTAAISGGLWLSYLFVLFYFAIAAGAVTHADLLLKNSVKLPFLNVELPLLAFFFLAPPLFLIVHAYSLVHLVLLAGRVRLFNDALSDAVSEDHIAWRRRLPSNIFVQFLGAPAETRLGAFGWLLGAILWVTMVLAPIALILLLQVQFLPYHSLWITWTSRISLILDLGLIWWLWRNILGSRPRHRNARRWWSVANTTMAATLSAVVILFSFAVALIPGEWQAESALSPLQDWIFAGPFDPITLRQTSFFSNRLVLPGFNIYDALKIDDPKKVELKEHVIDLRGRHLENAIFRDALLPNVDLTGAYLQGTEFNRARLQGALLDFAELQGASLEGAQLQGASLKRAQLQGALLFFTQLQGALLDFAELQGALVDLAQLQGASLEFADLQGTSVKDAFLWRADLDHTRFKDVLGGLPNWGPEQMEIDPLQEFRFVKRTWTDATYAALRHSIELIVPNGVMRHVLFERIAILDCARRNADIASCDPSASLPGNVVEWEHTVEAASVSRDVGAKPLAAILGDLVCSSGPEVLRGLLYSGRLADAGKELPNLARRIISGECPTSKVLTDADKRRIHESVDNASR